MAHSQIVVVIAFSITFGIDATIVRHRRPLGNLGSAVVFQSPCTMICRGMLPFAFVCFDTAANSFRLAPASCGFLQLVCIC